MEALGNDPEAQLRAIVEHARLKLPEPVKSGPASLEAIPKEARIWLPPVAVGGVVDIQRADFEMAPGKRQSGFFITMPIDDLRATHRYYQTFPGKASVVNLILSVKSAFIEGRPLGMLFECQVSSPDGVKGTARIKLVSVPQMS